VLNTPLVVIIKMTAAKKPLESEYV
jgi:hypothetical protein